MSFDWRVVALIAIFPYGLLSCSLNVGESPDSPQTIQTKKINCLNEAESRFSSYFSGEMKSHELNEYFVCLDQAIKNFSTYAKGEQPDLYLKEELRQEAQHVLFDGKPLPDRLIDSAMSVKVLIAGGNKDFVTRKEIDRVREFIGLLKVASTHAIPHVATIRAARQNSEFDRDKVQGAVEAIRVIVKPLGVFVGQRENQFDLRDLYAFVDEMSSHTESRSNTQLWVELIISFKGLVLPNDKIDSTLNTKDFGGLIDELVVWFEKWFIYRKTLQTGRSLWGENLESFIQTSDEILDLFRITIDRQLSKVVRYTKVFSIIDALEPLELLPKPFRSETIKSLVRPLFDKVFGDISKKFADRHQSGIDRKSLALLEKEFYGWVDLQRFLFANFQKIKSSFSTTMMLPFDLSGQGAFSEMFGESPSKEGLFEELKNTILSLKPLYLNGDPRVFVAPESQREEKGLTNNFYQLSILNVIRAIAQLMVRGYADDLDRAYNSVGLRESEIVAVIEDLRPLLQDLAIIPPDRVNPGKSIFLEANTFTYQGDGLSMLPIVEPQREFMNLKEGIELFSYLYSSIQIGRNVYESIGRVCFTGPTDVFDRPLYYDACFWKQLIPELVNELDNLPLMKNFLKPLVEIKKENREIWYVTQAAMEKLIVKPEDGHWIGYAHTGKLVMILHYIETILSRYDQDENGIMNESESDVAFPLFEGLIDRMGHANCTDLDREWRDRVYKFILKNAKIPGNGVSLWLDGWMGDVVVDRLQALKILGEIISTSESIGENGDCDDEEKGEEFREDLKTIIELENN